MIFNITRKSRVLIVALAVCLLTAFVVPTVFAQPLTSPSDSSAPASGSGFATLDEDGGMLLIGTAKIPAEDGKDLVSVKYIYSDGLMLNQKSVELICRELKYCGITISQEMLVSDSDISDDGMTDARVAIFACGSAAKPTELVSYEPRKSAEESFKLLYPAYNFSISDYASLKNLFEGNENVTLSEDGKTAYTSLIMGESYTEKIINGKPVLVLTVNSEFRYSFRAPKMACERDENYVSDSDWHYPDVSGSDTDTTSTTSTAVTTSTTVTEASTEPSTTTSASEPTQITAAASPVVTTTEADTTTSSEVTTISSSATAASATTTTASTTASTTKKSTTTTTITTTTKKTTTSTTTSKTTVSSTTKKITTVTRETTTTTNDNPVFNRTTINSLSSERGIVNTRRLPLNIRSGPGKKYMVVTVLPKGAYVTVLSTENPDWYMVKTMGKVVGYAYSEYIRIM